MGFGFSFFPLLFYLVSQKIEEKKKKMQTSKLTDERNNSTQQCANKPVAYDHELAIGQFWMIVSLLKIIILLVI